MYPFKRHVSHSFISSASRFVSSTINRTNRLFSPPVISRSSIDWILFLRNSLSAQSLFSSLPIRIGAKRLPCWLYLLCSGFGLQKLTFGEPEIVLLTEEKVRLKWDETCKENPGYYSKPIRFFYDGTGRFFVGSNYTAPGKTILQVIGPKRNARSFGRTLNSLKISYC